MNFIFIEINMQIVLVTWIINLHMPQVYILTDLVDEIIFKNRAGKNTQ